MKAGRLAGTLVVGSIVLALTAGQAPAGRLTFPGTNGKIAFGVSGSIVTVDPDGSNRKVVIAASTGLPAAEPAWSADGTRIVFVATAGPTPGIWYTTADGATRTRVTQKQNDKSPTWSPDGTKIAFVRNDTGFDRLFVVNADGTGETDVTASQSVNIEHPDWSPDGTKFAFSNGSRIYTVNADGSNLQLLTGLESGNADFPSWSPDGTRIAFSGQGGIRVVQPDGSGKAVLVAQTSTVWDVSWSPDGQKLAFVENAGGPLGQELWTANADGTGVTRLNAASEAAVSWGAAAPTSIPPPTGATTGTVLVNGTAFTGGTVPYNATVDVTQGAIVLTTTTGKLRVFPAGAKSAVFVLHRGTDSGRPIVELALAHGDFSVCPKRRTKSAGATAPVVVRQLWGDGTGSFRTRGRYGAATVRGTRWLTADRCDGTLTRVTRGVVQVNDTAKHKLVTVRAPGSYLAKP
jgi:Tol biopolymer transport system component